MHSFPTSWRAGAVRALALSAAVVAFAGCQSEQKEGLGPATQAGIGPDTIVTVEASADAWYQALQVSPQTVTVAPGQTVSFKALTWKAGVSAPAAFPVAWSATGGTINSSGVFTAGSRTGTFQVTARGTTTAYEDYATVTISGSATPSPTVSRINLTPATVTLATGASQQFSVSATMSDGSTQSSPSVTWSATGGTVSGSGLYKAGTAAGAYRVIALSGNGKADTSAVTVTASTAAISVLNLTPASVTLAAGATAQFSVSATMSDGSTQQNPSVTWAATGGTLSSGHLFTAGSTAGSYRVIVTSSNGRADTSAVTVTVTAPPPPPPSGGTGSALFTSDWRSGDLLDGGKWKRWGGQGILNIVSASGLGFPAGMTNVMRVAMGTGSFDWVEANGKWSLPAIGESRVFRLYLRNNVANISGGWSSTHPIESKGTDGSIAGNFWAWHIGSNADGTFPIALAVQAPYPRNYWTTANATGSVLGTLQKQTTYRIEWKFTRTGSNQYSLDMRIYGADDRTLVADRNTIKAWGGSSLASNPSGITIDDAFMTGIRVGLNGGFSASGSQYVYYGGFAVCSDWCGAY